MTTIFYLSVAINIVLIFLIGVLYQRAKQRIIDEKVATFGGCIAAISLGLLREDRQRGIKATIEGIRRMRHGMDGDEIEFRLVRAAACRLQRNDLAFDLMGETAHADAPQLYGPSEKAEKIADYVQGLDYSAGDPREIYGDEGLFLAEIREEIALLNVYRTQLINSKLNPFGSVTPMR
jgi:hypothetical protein